METEILAQIDEKAMIQKKFDELSELAKKTYPDLDATVLAFNTTMVESKDFFGFQQLIAVAPTEVSTNQFTLQ